METTIIAICVVILTALACFLAYLIQRTLEAPRRRHSELPQLSARVVSHVILASCFGVPHTKYEIVTSLGKEKKRCYRRFADFYQFFTRMNSILPRGDPALENFPRKKMFTSLTATTIDDRRRQLDAFLLNISSTAEGRKALGSFCDLPLNLAPGLPIEQAELIAQAEVTVESLIGTWSLEKQNGDVKVFSQRTQEGRKAFKTEIILDATEEEVWNQISDSTVRMKWDKCIEKGSTVETYGTTGHDVIQYVTAAVGGGAVSSRHFVLRRRVSKRTSGIVCIVAADGNDESVPTEPGSVRVKHMSLRQVIEQTSESGKVKLTEILSMDPGGNLPAWLVDNATATELSNSGVALRDHLEKLRF